MDYIADSDDDNSLPCLPPEFIDKNQLRDVFSILSETLKTRIRNEARGTPMEAIYEEIERHQEDAHANYVATSEQDGEHTKESGEHSDSSLATRTRSHTTEHTFHNLEPTEHTQELGAAGISNVEAHPLNTEHTNNVQTILSSPLRQEQTYSRSLRKRTFASKHPYIADQADWLGICTVDGINEMFSENDDISKVIRALNQLYLKRKKRYPDEERYKARDFYAHLGRSKMLALTGDPDVASQDINQSVEEYEPDNDEKLIPYEGPVESEIELQSETESSDDEQLIRIGGRYRKLSRILRGVLPESAKRLTMFQERAPIKRRRSARKPVQPRKGLGVKKFGSVSTQSDELQREIALIDDIPKPDMHLSTPSPRQRMLDLVEISEVSSDSDSDSVEELFSDNVNEVYLNLNYLYVDSDSATEADHINHMFSAPKRGSRGKPPKRNDPKRRQNQRGSTREDSRRTKNEPKRLRDVTNLPRQKRSYNYQGPLKKRKLTSIRSKHPAKVKGDVEISEAKKADAKKGEKKAKDKPHVYQRPTGLSYRRDPVVGTTVVEVESSTRFVHNQGVRGTFPETFIPTKETLFGVEDFGATELLPQIELSKIDTIGDGHIFFQGEDGVVFTLVGKKYALGLYRLEESNTLTERYFLHLRKLVLDANMVLNASIRTEIHHSLKLMVRWILIARKSPLEVTWRYLNTILNDFTKLQTREVRMHQCVIFARLLLVFYIFFRIESSQFSASHMANPFDAHASDFWSVFFQTFTASEVSLEFSPGSRSLLVDSLGLMYSMFRSREQIWWVPINEALHDSVAEDKIQLLDLVYILASMVPNAKPHWGCFLTILSSLKSERLSPAYHHFVDICVLANQRLLWNYEERVITQLYSTFALRKFGNFSDESSVPRALGQVHTRMDIPESSLFERFMGVLYNYVSELSSKKDVKRLVSKLVASSQYQYHVGRKYQIQFVNRLNLITLLFQISDVDLSTPFVNLVELVANSKDMFIYGRTVDSLILICQVAKSRNSPIPLEGFDLLFGRFCEYYASLFGMPNLLKRTTSFISEFFCCDNDTFLYKLLKDVNMTNFPDSVLPDLLTNIFLTTFAVLNRPDLNDIDIGFIADFQKSLINFLGSQMGRIPVLKQEKVEEIVELAIQIWMLTASITGTLHWNVMMLQKYSYIGNSELREYFMLLMCEEYMKSGPLDASIVGEIDTIMLKSLISYSISKYAPFVYRRLSRTPHSVFMRITSVEVTTLSQIQTLRSQLVSSVILNICSSSISTGNKVAYIRGVIDTLRLEHSRHFTLTNYVDFCKQTVDQIQKSAKSYVNDMDEFWEFGVSLGFPNRRMQLSWNESSELDRLQMLNNEFLGALQYKKSIRAALDNWISMSNITILFTLVQLYLEAVSIHKSHWAHLSQLLQYAFAKLQTFQVRVQDLSFKLFLDMLVDVAAKSSRWNNDNYVMFELNALNTCTLIFDYSFFVYDGYRDKADFIDTANEFVDAINEPRDYEQKSHFTKITFGMLRGTSHSSYQPSFHHSAEEYSKAYDEQENCLACLRQRLQPEKEFAGIDFDFDM